MEPCYGYDAVESLRRRGVLYLEFWCVGRDHSGRICGNRYTLDIKTVIERHGPGTPLIMLARRCRCKLCGHLGAHVQPAEPPREKGPRAHLYRAWLQGELERCTAFLAQHGWNLEGKS